MMMLSLTARQHGQLLGLAFPLPPVAPIRNRWSWFNPLVLNTLNGFISPQLRLSAAATLICTAAGPNSD